MNEDRRERNGKAEDDGTSAPAGAAELKEARKRHGDALVTGTGSRHGVHDREERPNIGAREDAGND